jgi:hypothetical protein
MAERSVGQGPTSFRALRARRLRRDRELRRVRFREAHVANLIAWHGMVELDALAGSAPFIMPGPKPGGRRHPWRAF